MESPNIVEQLFECAARFFRNAKGADSAAPLLTVELFFPEGKGRCSDHFLELTEERIDLADEA
jgi:hypothetical protein